MPDDRTTIRQKMLDEHAAIEQMVVDVLAACEAGDGDSVRRGFAALSERLVSHLDIEDRHMLPHLYRRSPRRARGIAEEHKYLRGRLVDIQAQLPRQEGVAALLVAFLEELRAHVRSEERALYEWSDVGLAEAERIELLKKVATR